jgi:hypothetical protein
MKRQIVIYKAKPEHADENQRMLEQVFEELHAKQPDGVRYLLARMNDGTFVHLIVSGEDGPPSFTKLDSFKAYVAGVRDRIVAPPQQSEATIVGDYRMLSE